jgi:pimeloyl-ACP methyl ester carboxylesterase
MLSRANVDYVDEHPEALDRLITALGETPLEAWVAGNRALMGVNLSTELARCTVPTLLIAGELDTITPLDQPPSGLGMRQVAELMPNATLDIFWGRDHYTVFDCPEEHVGKIVQFTTGLNG